MHLGNSLTQTTGGFRLCRTAGYDHQSFLFARPGALTRELWSPGVRRFPERQTGQRQRKRWRWAKGIPRGRISSPSSATVDLLTLQPRDFDLEKEVAAEVSFIKAFREKSPDIQPYLYCRMGGDGPPAPERQRRGAEF